MPLPVNPLVVAVSSMVAFVDGLALLALGAWMALLLVPWRPWTAGPLLDASPGARERGGAERFDDMTVLIPARNEAATLANVLASLLGQGRDLAVVVVDDRSEDATADIAAGFRDRAPGARGGFASLEVVRGRPLEPGWSGKVWAQHQGEAYLDRPLTLLLDADIVLAPGALAALRAKLAEGDYAMVSLMARLRTCSVWERLLVPPFVFFFKQLYPFRLAANPRSKVAAGAGGCVLLRTQALQSIGGFERLRDALIDDCTLAALIKGARNGIWIGCTHSVHSLRRYANLDGLWRMVARTAFTQLRYSALLLGGCVFAMLVVFAGPLLGLAVGSGAGRIAGAGALGAMCAAYWPTVRFYGLGAAWTLTLPLAAGFYVAMTVDSARRYWLGERSSWRGRRYAA
ncbi:MAG: glycosyltransferase [Gammaproteobacteria bacterium]